MGILSAKNAINSSGSRIPISTDMFFCVKSNWFLKRLKATTFSHKSSENIVWSGINDLVVSSAEHFKYLVHPLGHTFGLRRQDYFPNDSEQQEEYNNFYIGQSAENVMTSLRI